ncbi:uncharacterized protein FLJ30774-like [Nomascus leucogenys]|uniref:uncharacterized protein FLJ30774-like n=1 Tax=Nomascus leucogenys TaxID=61853 RepID=UPI00122D6EAA|nr:uncharacterized protein FLJ30774-like [Nomascus leucogenys]
MRRERPELRAAESRLRLHAGCLATAWPRTPSDAGSWSMAAVSPCPASWGFPDAYSTVLSLCTEARAGRGGLATARSPVSADSQGGRAGSSSSSAALRLCCAGPSQAHPGPGPAVLPGRRGLLGSSPRPPAPQGRWGPSPGGVHVGGEWARALGRPERPSGGVRRVGAPAPATARPGSIHILPRKIAGNRWALSSVPSFSGGAEGG